MKTATVERQTLALMTPAAPVVTSDQLDLIKRTVAKDATADELKLYIYDCERQGVHPLDKLIHFTKRQGKYTPITSIDFMRTRAADTGEYAGSDDALYEPTPNQTDKHPESARVTVWRLVQGQRCPFTATARWAEYKPTANDFMWLKMPHTMLGKCAEALALRKGFPRQLAGLYAKEEMDQAGPATGGYSVGASIPPALARASIEPDEPREHSTEGEFSEGPDLAVDVPDGAVVIERVDMTPTRNPNVKRYLLTLSTGEQLATIKEPLAKLAEQLAQERCPIRYAGKEGKYGLDLVELERAMPESWKPFAKEPARADADLMDHGTPITDSDIPFAWLLPFIAPIVALVGAGMFA